MSSTFEKIKIYMQGLDNELSNLTILSQNLETKNRELIDKETTLNHREKDIVAREANVLSETHAVEEAKRKNEKDTTEFLAKQNKLANEWQRMNEDKERLDMEKEEAARERLRLTNKEKELEKMIVI